MGQHLPVVSGDRLVRALKRVGWVIVRQRGSHVRLKRGTLLISISVHAGRAIPPGTLATILDDAGLTPDELRKLL
jgi:predicted RNA binding protein YcfA (HicA-like mRNA interferase family)